MQEIVAFLVQMYRTKAYDFCSIANVNMIFNGAYSVSSRAVNRIALNNRDMFCLLYL